LLAYQLIHVIKEAGERERVERGRGWREREGEIKRI
jgi:hypothetical protein